ncbi:MAG: class I SAM-dependent methyltransferase [Pseudomonadales bacterium]|nr:class I SAM-dependent methyltransferase [Pseudomonadales bacterium]
MTRLDRQKWDRRYSRGSELAGAQPSEWLLRSLALAGFDRGDGRAALDVACGTGRDALYLAALGFSVDAVDISPVALAQASAASRERELSINWLEADLDLAFRPPRTYDLILMIHYVNLPLMEKLTLALRPGGWLVSEQYLHTSGVQVGPRRAEYRVASGALAAACGDLEIVEQEEGTSRDRLGRTLAVSRVAARRSVLGH